MKAVKPIMRVALLSTISAASLCLGTAAMAQDADAADEEFSDNDIIVTATKREQTLQEIPVAVSVTSAEAIEKAQVRDLIDLQTLAPTLRVNQLQSSANTNFIIRGFGNGANNAGIEPSVGVFIDGVYRSRSAAQIGDLPNLKRVEVLRGPQSTLFGKNASAGVISIVTAAPQFVFGGSAELSYGNYDAIIAKADVTGPLSETIAFSLAANYNKRDGYARDLNLQSDVNERNRWGTRAQLLFQPSEDLTIRLIGDYDDIDEDCCVAGNVINGPTLGIPGLPLNGDVLAGIIGGTAYDAENPFSYDVYTNLPSSNRIKNYGGSSQVDYDFGQIDLTSITAYRRVESFTNQDSDFSAADLLQKNSSDTNIKTFTQELRLASNFDGPLNFLLGGYYFNEKIDVVNDIEFGKDFRPFGAALVGIATQGAFGADPISALELTFGSFDGDPTQYLGSFFAQGTGLDEGYRFKDRAWSIFGSVDLEITDRLTLTGGFNYTDDKKRFRTNVTATESFAAIDLDAPQYAPFRQQILEANGVDSVTAAFLAANPTITLPDGTSANPLGGLKGFQFLPPYLNVPNSVEPGRTKDTDWSYSARLAYEATDNINLYVSYATGFKASSINLSRDARPPLSARTAIENAGIAVPNQTYGSRFAGPEDSKVLEAGLKASWDQVAFNLTVFDQTIRGFQSNVFTGTGFALANAGKQSTFGVEFDGTVSPIDGLTFSAAFVYLDPKYDSFINSSFGDLSGTQPSGIPELSTTLGVSYDIDLGNDYSLTLRTDYHYESSVALVDDPTLTRFQREVNQLNASATVALNNGLQVTVWGRNLTDAQYLTTIFPSVGQRGSQSGYPSQPRTYGVSAKYKF